MAAYLQDEYESSSDTTDEEVVEAKFKYTRLQNDDLKKIFDKDKAHCIAVHEKFLALGTEWGRVFIIDHMGTIIPNKVVPAHATAVNQISIDLAGDYLATCSNDGKIVIFGMCSNDCNQTVSMDRPIRSVAIQPEFGRLGQQFVTGDRVLVLHEKGFLSRDKRTTIFIGKDTDGIIHNIVWRKSYICFANDSGIRVYDRDRDRGLVTHVLRQHDLGISTVECPAHITWFDDSTFAVAWANTVTVCTIKGPTSTNLPQIPLLNSGAAVADKYAEILHMFEFPNHFVSGISYTSPAKYLVLFAVIRPGKGRSDSEAGTNTNGLATTESVEIDHPLFPRLMLVEPVTLHERDVLSEDIITVEAAESLFCRHYHLVGLGNENSYFLMLPQSLIAVRPTDADDHVDFLLDNDGFEEALEFTKEHANTSELRRHTVLSVGKSYLEHLIEINDFEAAAKLCSQVCGKKKDLWEQYVDRFERLQSLKHLAPYLPTKDPQLEAECYETILIDFLRNDIPGFQRLIKQWPSDAYRVGAIIKESLDKLYKLNMNKGSLDPSHSILLQTIALLYTYERNYDRALSVYMTLMHKDIFKLIQTYRLFPLVQNQIQKLMLIDTNLAVKLLIDNEDSLSPATVVKQLNSQPKLQLAYLERVFGRSEGAAAEFADLAVSLFADHDPKRLLMFLRSNSEYYKISRALEICRQRGLVDCEVFLLARSGNRREALRVTMNNSSNIDQAIEFCKEHDDADLWNDLIACAVKKPEFITVLMQNVGTHVEPTLLIRQIPAQMQIPGLRDSLVKTLQDYNTQISLQEGCQRVLMTDCHNLQMKLHKERCRGFRVDFGNCCFCCQKNLLINALDPRTLTDFMLFQCGHIRHKRCPAEAHQDAAVEATRSGGASVKENLRCLLCASIAAEN